MNQAGEPVSNAVVSTVEIREGSGADLRSALTDGDGQFQLEADSRLPVHLTVWHSAYATELRTTGAGVGNVVIRLREGGTVVGTVNRTSGVAIANAEVRVAYAKNALPFQPPTTATGGALRTDGDGRFVLKRMMPGAPFRLEILVDGVVRASSSQMVVRAGETSTLELVAREPVTLAGQVIDERGAAVPDAVVIAWTHPDGREGFHFQSVPVVRARSDVMGMFQVSSTSGSNVTIRAAKVGYRDGDGRVAVSQDATGTVTVRVVLVRKPS